MKLASRVASLVGVIALLSTVPARAAGWQKLGQGVVDYRTNPQSIETAAGSGSFSKIKIEVKESSLEIQNVKVTFTDGQTFSMDLNKYIGAGSSQVVDLPGAKEIQKVEFTYRGKTDGESSRLALVKLLGGA